MCQYNKQTALQRKIKKMYSEGPSETEIFRF